MDQDSITLEKCSGSCRQMWMVNAPFFNGSTPVRRLAFTKKATAPVHSSGTRVLCWVMTNPLNHATKAKAVMETWGRKCDFLIFVSTEQVSHHESRKLMGGGRGKVKGEYDRLGNEFYTRLGSRDGKEKKELPDCLDMLGHRSVVYIS